MKPIKLNTSTWGSGKTSSMYTSIKEALKTSSNVIIVGCSLKQLDTYYSTLGVGIICSSTKSLYKVKSQIISALKRTKVVYCTSQGFSAIRDTDSIDFDNTIVFYDEVPNVMNTQEMSTGENDTTILSKNDDVQESAVLEGSFTINSISVSLLSEFICPWKSLTIYAANGMVTPFGRLLELSGIPFEIIADFEPVDFSNVKVLCPNIGSSKLTKQLKYENPYIFKSMYQTIAIMYPDSKYVYISNKYDPAIKTRNAIRMPHNVAGDNDYRHIHIMAMFSTLNLTPAATKKMCERFQCDYDYLTTLISVSILMQSAFRTSMRDDINSGECVVVADAYLIKLAVKYGFIKNANIEYFDIIEPKSVVAARIRADKKKTKKKDEKARKKCIQSKTIAEMQSKKYVE